MVESIILINENLGTSLPINVSSRDYVLDSVDWGAIQSSRQSYKFINQVGVYVTNTTLESRTVSIVAWVVADSQEEMTYRKKFLNSFISPLNKMELQYEDYKIIGIPDTTIKYGTTEATNNEVICKFMVNLFCPDPTFYNILSFKKLIVGWLPKFRFPLAIPSGNIRTVSGTFPIELGLNVENSITKVKRYGTTYQAGTGDSSPTNIRPISGVGQYDTKIVLDGSDDEAWKLSGTGDIAYFSINQLSESGASVPMITSDFPTVLLSGSNTTQGAGNWNTSFYLRWKTLFTAVSELRAYLAAHPLTVYYQSPSYSTATQVYDGISIADANGYHGYGFGPIAPLFSGDTLEISGSAGKEFSQKEYHTKKKITFNGSEYWGTLLWGIPEGAYGNTDHLRFIFGAADVKQNTVPVCDSFKGYPFSNIPGEGVMIGNSAYIQVVIAKSRLATQDVAGFKAWLASHNITIVYEIATPTETLSDGQNFISNYTGMNTLYSKGSADISYKTTSTKGIIMGLRSPSTIIEIENKGDIPCGIVVNLRASGHVLNPRIININTQEQISFNYAMVSGDEIRVSTLENDKTVTKTYAGKTVNGFNLINFETTTFLSMSTGKNYLRYDADEGLDNLTVEIEFDERFLEVQK